MEFHLIFNFIYSLPYIKSPGVKETLPFNFTKIGINGIKVNKIINSNRDIRNNESEIIKTVFKLV